MMNITSKKNANYQTHKNNRLQALKKYKAKTLKNILISFNKAVRKETYKGVSKMKRSETENFIASDFKMIPKNNNRHQFRHKSDRFTKIYSENK